MTSYSIDVRYAYARLGLKAGASLTEAEEVLVNAAAYRFGTRVRLADVQRLVEFFRARDKFGDLEDSFADIKKAYHKKAMALHPDRNRRRNAEEQLKAVNLAFEQVEKIYREARDYFRQDEEERRAAEIKARQARERETPQPGRRAADGKKQRADRKSRKAAGAIYMAASVPRFIRVARLGHIRLNHVIGSWFVKQRSGGNYIFDIIMLPEREFARMRAYLAAPDAGNVIRDPARFIPPYILNDVKEIVVPENEPDPENFAREYFLKEFKSGEQA